MTRTTTRRTRALTVPKIVKGNEHAIFAALVKQAGLPPPATEVRFAAPRRWRFDYAWPPILEGKPVANWPGVALEVEGGAYTRGRHTRGKGFIADMEKYNEAALRGWIVLRVTPQQLCTLETVELIRRALSPTEAPASKNPTKMTHESNSTNGREWVSIATDQDVKDVAWKAYREGCIEGSRRLIGSFEEASAEAEGKASAYVEARWPIREVPQ